MDTNTVKVIETFGNKLDGYIEVLASKLGLAADHFWPVFVQQQIIEGWCSLFGIALFTILSILMFRFAFKHLNPEVSAPGDEPRFILGLVCGVIFGVVAVISTLADGPKKH